MSFAGQLTIGILLFLAALFYHVWVATQRQKWTESIVNYNFSPPYFYSGLFQARPCEHAMCPLDQCAYPVVRELTVSQEPLVTRTQYFIGPGTAEHVATVLPGERIVLAPTLRKPKVQSLDCTICSCPPEDYCQPAKALVNQPHNLARNSNLHNAGYCDGCGVLYD